MASTAAPVEPPARDPFDPTKHMRQFERRQRQPDGTWKTITIDYLDVKWRLVWFTEEHPEGSIVTELLSAPGADPAVVKATVTFQVGDVEKTTTGHGQQGKDDWSDYLEKAETRAIGRALAAAGYGTQFAGGELDDVVDAPVSPAQRTPPKQAAPKRSAPKQQPKTNGNGHPGSASEETGELATEKQIRAIYAIAGKVGFNTSDSAEILAWAEGITGRAAEHVKDYTKAEASTLIKHLQEFE